MILGIEDLSQGSGSADGWSVRFGETGRQTVEDVELAGEDLIITGSFQDAIDFGGGPLPNAGGVRLYVASFARGAGAHRWSKSFADAGATAAPPPARIAADGDDVIVAGAFTGSLGFGDVLLSSTTPDVFAARIGPGGEPLWTEGFGGTGSQIGVDVAASLGAVAITGSYDAAFDLGAGALPAPGNTDAFVGELDGQDAATAWSVGLGNLGVDQGARVAISDSAVVVAGSTSAGFTAGTVSVPAGLFLASIDRTGAVAWLKGFGDVATHLAGVAVDGEGNVVVAGDFTDTVNLGTPLVSEGAADVFLVKLDAAGTELWSHQFGGAGSQTCWDVHVTPAGDVAITGAFAGSIDLGGEPLASAGGADAFVAVFDADGIHRLSRGFGGAGDQTGRGVAIDGLGAVFLVGQFERAIDLGEGELTAQGVEDLFVAKLSPAEP